MTRSFFVATALLASVTVASLFGCEDDEKVLVGEGGTCASIVDCQAGLSCVASGDGRVCKTTTTPVPIPPADPDAETPDGGDPDAETPDGEAPDADPDAAPTEDAGDAAPADANDAAPADASDAG